MTIRTCFFDMGNVLVYFSHDRMCANIAALCGWTDEQVRSWLIDEGRQWKLERGEQSEEEFCEELSRACGRKLPLAELLHAAANIFWLNDSIVPLLHQIKANGIRLVLLSNTSLTHVRFIQARFDVLDLMDHRITSWEVGGLKPDAVIYEAALAAAECQPHECFYTDDIPAYVDKARTFGIQAHVYTDTPQLQRDLQLHGVL